MFVNLTQALIGLNNLKSELVNKVMKPSFVQNKLRFCMMSHLWLFVATPKSADSPWACTINQQTMPLVAGFLSRVLACHTIEEKKNESLVWNPPTPHVLTSLLTDSRPTTLNL